MNGEQFWNEHFARRLHDLRVSAGMSQKELAAGLKLSPQAYGPYEVPYVERKMSYVRKTNFVPMTVGKYMLVSRVMGVRPEEFLQPTDQETASREVAVSVRSRDYEERLERALRMVPMHKREDMVKLVEEVAEMLKRGKVD